MGIGSGLGDTSFPVDPNVEYIQGDINIIISVPHDGRVKKNFEKRQPGCKDNSGKCQFGDKTVKCAGKSVCKISTFADSNSSLLARSVFNKFMNITGKKPSFVMSHLHRSRLDPNREVNEAAQGNEKALKAYNAFHGSIEHAQKTFNGKPGFLLDFHGYSDKKGQNSTLLGYLIRPNDLNKEKYDKEKSSVKALVERSNETLEEILFGNKTSLGALFERSGYKALPSPRQRKPDGDKYFNGGYITQQYGSRDEGNIDAIQLEFPSWIRTQATKEIQDAFCDELANNIACFYFHFYH